MKKLILCLLTLISLSDTISAQRIEVFGGYSYGSEVGKLVKSIPSLPSENGPMKFNDTGSNGAFTIGVSARVFKNFSAGLSWTSKSYKERIMNYGHHSSFHWFRQSSSSLLLSFKYDWFKFRKLNLYSRVGVGMVFYSDPQFHSGLSYTLDDFIWSNGKPKACTRFAWQASLVGVEYRPIKWVGVFAEGGLGRQGALLAGLKVFI